MEFAPGTRLGDYLLLDCLGSGGMAEVYAAYRLGLDGFMQPVALKCLTKDVSEDEAFIAQFVNEAHTGSRLQHPNIVAIQDFSRIQGVYYIAMELVDGVDLRFLLSALKPDPSRLTPRLAAYIIRMVLKALGYAYHCVGSDGRPLHVIHRDLKPANIMVNRLGQVKVADYGIAKAPWNPSGSDGLVKGTLPYMSPEQLLGAPLTAASDLFAAATVLYELLTFERLFQGTPIVKLIERVKRADVEDRLGALTGDAVPFVPILRRALARDPADRFPDARAFGNALEPLCAGERELADLARIVNDHIEGHRRDTVPSRIRVLDRDPLSSPRSCAHCGAGKEATAKEVSPPILQATRPEASLARPGWAPSIGVSSLPAARGTWESPAAADPASPAPTVDAGHGAPNASAPVMAPDSIAPCTSPFEVARPQDAWSQTPVSACRDVAPAHDPGTGRQSGRSPRGGDANDTTLARIRPPESAPPAGRPSSSYWRSQGILLLIALTAPLFARTPERHSSGDMTAQPPTVTVQGSLTPHALAYPPTPFHVSGVRSPTPSPPDAPVAFRGEGPPASAPDGLACPTAAPPFSPCRLPGKEGLGDTVVRGAARAAPRAQVTFAPRRYAAARARWLGKHLPSPVHRQKVLRVGMAIARDDRFGYERCGLKALDETFLTLLTRTLDMELVTITGRPDRIARRLDQGDIVAIVGDTWSLQQATLAPLPPHLVVGTTLLVRHGDKLGGPEQLSNLTVGVAANLRGIHADRFIPGATTVGIAPVDAPRLLVQKRIDLALVSLPVAIHFVRKHAGELRLDGPLLPPMAHRALVRRGDSRLVRLLGRTIRTIRVSSKYLDAVEATFGPAVRYLTRSVFEPPRPGSDRRRERHGRAVLAGGSTQWPAADAVSRTVPEPEAR